MLNLFGEDVQDPTLRTVKGKLNDYEGFTEKFKPKKTTDDCYTPPLVYDAIRRWIGDNLMKLDGVEVVRPFYPGGDFERFDYPDGCLVLDNPPFSILSRIRRFYHLKGIRYFLFAPTLTIANSAKELDCTYIICGTSITYENGAVVPTSFITNLPGDTRIWCAGELSKIIDTANKENLKAARKPENPVYVYPPQVVSAALIQKIAKRGVEWRVPKKECVSINRLDSQANTNKAIFGGGWLISERAAAERAAAERAAAERAAAERAAERERRVWLLSRREMEIVERLGEKGDGQ